MRWTEPLAVSVTEVGCAMQATARMRNRQSFGTVHGADVQGRDGALGLIERSCDAYPTLVRLFADGGYAGQKPEAAVAHIDRLTIEIISV